MERLGALLQVIYPDAENVENHWLSLLFGASAALGGLLKRLGAVLEPSWSFLGAVLELLLLSILRLMLLQLLRSPLGSIPRRLVLLAFLVFLVLLSFWRRKTR